MRGRGGGLVPGFCEIHDHNGTAATDVRASLAPEGREEAKKELRDMRRVTFTGFAGVLRRLAGLLEKNA